MKVQSVIIYGPDGIMEAYHIGKSRVTEIVNIGNGYASIMMGEEERRDIHAPYLQFVYKPVKPKNNGK